MSRIALGLALPLLRKELLEAAARRRTYVLRTIFAVLFFGMFLMLYWGAVGRTRGFPPGVGGDLFRGVVVIQMLGVLAIVPAFLAGAITQEQERASIEVLFVTTLGPWTILFEKLFGRLVPVLAYLLVCLPTLAVVYALGGTPPHAIFAAAWILFCACLQVACLSLFASTFFRTTAAAFISSYLICGALFFGPIIAALLVTSQPSDELLSLFPIYAYMKCQGAAIGSTMLASLPILACTVPALLGARIFLYRHAFERVGKSLPRRALDALSRGSRSAAPGAGGSPRPTRSPRLPGAHPIAWRESLRCFCGTFRKRAALCFLLEAAVLAIGLVSLRNRAISEIRIPLLILLLWGVTILLVTVVGANLIASERNRQTLDILLSLPVSGKELVREKVRALRGLHLALFLPFLTAFLFRNAGRANSPFDPDPAGYLISSLLLFFIYVPLFSWLSVGISLRTKSRGRAIIVAVLAVAGWLIVPPILIGMISAMMRNSSDSIGYFLLMGSPLTMILCNEGPFPMRELFQDGMPIAVVSNAALYGFLLLVLRSACLNFADSCFGRP